MKWLNQIGGDFKKMVTNQANGIFYDLNKKKSYNFLFHRKANPFFF